MEGIITSINIFRKILSLLSKKRGATTGDSCWVEGFMSANGIKKLGVLLQW